MITQDQRDAAISATKVGSAWAAVGAATWAERAQMLAAMYTFCLICDFFWKRFGRPYAEGRGWVPRKRMRATDREDDE